MKRPYDRELTTEELLRLKDEDIDYSDIPGLDDSFWSSARVVMPERRNKTQVTAKFDADMVAWFKAQGRGYQTRMNAVLRSYYEAARLSCPAGPTTPRRSGPWCEIRAKFAPTARSRTVIRVVSQFDYSCRPESIPSPSFRPKPRIHPGRSGEIFHRRNTVQSIVPERFLHYAPGSAPVEMTEKVWD